MKINGSHFKRVLRFGFGAAIAIFLCQFDLHYLEFLTYDIRMQIKHDSPVSGNVETIAIDSLSVQTLQGDPKAKDHTQFIKELVRQKPRAVVYIFDPTKLEGTVEELEEFARVTEDLPAFYVASNLLPITGHEGQLKLEPPLQNISVYSGPKTFDQKIFAKDGVTRRYIFSYYGKQTLHPMLASTYNGLEFEEEYRGLWEFLGTYQGYIDFHPTGTYNPTSFTDLLDPEIRTPNFNDKIVFVGKDTMESTQDYVMTPFSREVTAMTNLEMHANLMDTLIQNRSLFKLPYWQDLFFTTLISILTVFVVLTMRPTRGLVILGSTLVGFILFSQLIFSFFGLWVGMSHPLLAIFISYYFFIPYRLIMENRKSWEYIQRNRLLTQVEELKSNFLRMMSHDLKTPLARIQGMTDIVLKDQHRLSGGQSEALGTIQQSSEELSDFIGSILSLGRIESKEIKLHLKSKDINSLLKEVIQKCDFLAKNKNITIITEFEPMFSINVDEDLLRQVFTNLIENAIKYSPVDSKVLISTEETDGQAIVQVADQGIGIPNNDLGNVFSKFYRSHNAKDTPIKGSGLGLYLARYFVELHTGDIEVESENAKGSTFTVKLPMDL